MFSNGYQYAKTKLAPAIQPTLGDTSGQSAIAPDLTIPEVWVFAVLKELLSENSGSIFFQQRNLLSDHIDNDQAVSRAMK